MEETRKGKQPACRARRAASSPLATYYAGLNQHIQGSACMAEATLDALSPGNCSTTCDHGCMQHQRAVGARCLLVCGHACLKRLFVKSMCIVSFSCRVWLLCTCDTAFGRQDVISGDFFSGKKTKYDWTAASKTESSCRSRHGSGWRKHAFSHNTMHTCARYLVT
jgi:hypothetical protein